MRIDFNLSDYERYNEYIEVMLSDGLTSILVLSVLGSDHPQYPYMRARIKAGLEQYADIITEMMNRQEILKGKALFDIEEILRLRQEVDKI